MDTNQNEQEGVEIGNALLNLHQILQTAAVSKPVELNDMTALKLKKELKLKVASICKEHGTSISAFLRTCCEVLVAEYAA